MNQPVLASFTHHTISAALSTSLTYIQSRLSYLFCLAMKLTAVDAPIYGLCLTTLASVVNRRQGV